MAVRPNARAGSVFIPRLIFLAIALLVAVYSVGAFVVPPEMYTDPAYGIQVWDSMLRGVPFNTFTRPDYGDIARDTHEFLAYWSPGQYLLPGPLEALQPLWAAQQ